MRCKFIKFSSLRALKKHCILYLVPLSGHYGGSHAIVFDAKERCIINPLDTPIDINQYNVTCCVELQPKVRHAT